MANNTKKITKRDNFNAIRAILRAANDAGIALEGNEMITYESLEECIENEIILLDKKAEAAQKRADKRKVEGDALRDRIYDVLPTEEFMVIDDIKNALNDPDVSNAMITARLKQLNDLGMVEKGMATVSSVVEGGKSKKLSAYRVKTDA